jgi:hypothetical protein
MLTSTCDFTPQQPIFNTSEGPVAFSPRPQDMSTQEKRALTDETRRNEQNKAAKRLWAKRRSVQPDHERRLAEIDRVMGRVDKQKVQFEMYLGERKLWPDITSKKNKQLNASRASGVANHFGHTFSLSQRFK